MAMRKIGLIVLALILFAGLASAQVPTSVNVFFGYSYYNASALPVETGRSNLNGWEGTFEGKIIPWVGMVADFSEHDGNASICIPPVQPAGSGPGQISCQNVISHEQNFLFGPRVSISVRKFRPFAQALFGGGHVNTSGFGSNTSFATALGGGLDYKIIRPVAWRFQGDYVQTRFFGATQNNVRLSTGIVLRF
jgi:opacity protein-like surface antigen